MKNRVKFIYLYACVHNLIISMLQIEVCNDFDACVMCMLSEYSSLHFRFIKNLIRHIDSHRAKRSRE